MMDSTKVQYYLTGFSEDVMVGSDGNSILVVSLLPTLVLNCFHKLSVTVIIFVVLIISIIIISSAEGKVLSKVFINSHYVPT